MSIVEAAELPAGQINVGEEKPRQVEGESA